MSTVTGTTSAERRNLPVVAASANRSGIRILVALVGLGAFAAVQAEELSGARIDILSATYWIGHQLVGPIGMAWLIRLRFGSRLAASAAVCAWFVTGWAFPSFSEAAGVIGYWGDARLLGAVVSVVAVTPSALVLPMPRPLTSPSARPVRDASLTAGIVLSTGLVLVVVIARAASTGFSPNIDQVLVLASVGACTGGRRVLIAPAVAIALVSTTASALWLINQTGPVQITELLSAGAIALAAATWWIAARVTANSTAAGLFVFTNALNVLDAASTDIAVEGQRANELNPLIRSSGLPAKVLLVAVASGLLWRYRPAALRLPAVALAVVVTWHLAGLISFT